MQNLLADMPQAIICKDKKYGQNDHDEQAFSEHFILPDQSLATE